MSIKMMLFEEGLAETDKERVQRDLLPVPGRFATECLHTLLPIYCLHIFKVLYIKTVSA